MVSVVAGVALWYGFPPGASAEDRAPLDDAADAAGPVASDPTGSAYTTPTLLFVPAAALPSLDVRVITGVGLQSPAGALDGVQPHLGAEVGLGAGFTAAAGSRWFGGDAGTASLLDGLTPFGQLRYQLFGDAHAPGLLGAVVGTYKRVGYRDGESELEASVTIEVRRPRFEAGANAVFGQSLAEAGEHDLELHAFVGVRPLPVLLVGAAGQARADVGGEEEGGEAEARRQGRSNFDLQGGGIASLTLGEWQLGTLVGTTTIGLHDRAALLAELFAAVRFGRASARPGS